jgi:hypothetical protein
MLFARLILALQAIVMLGLGLAYWLYPYEMANLNGMLLMEPASASNTRVYYGGLQVGLAIFLIWSMWRSERIRSALVLLILTQLGLALARLASLWQDGGGMTEFALSALVFKLIMVTLGAVALFQLEEQPVLRKHWQHPLDPDTPQPVRRASLD